jgi:hypothetical protein
VHRELRGHRRLPAQPGGRGARVPHGALHALSAYAAAMKRAPRRLRAGSSTR